MGPKQPKKSMSSDDVADEREALALRVVIDLLQNMCRANMHAINTDHDYFILTPEQHFLELHITKITPERITEIEENTRGHSTSPLWPAERTKRITASTFGRIWTMTDRTDPQTFV